MSAGSVLEIKDFEACSQLWYLLPPRHGKSVIRINSLVGHGGLASCGMAAASQTPAFFISSNTYHSRAAGSFCGTKEREEHPKGHAAQLNSRHLTSTSFWKEL